MKRAFIYNEALDDVVTNQLAQCKERGEHCEGPEYKRIELDNWDLDTLVYVLGVDLRYEEKWMREYPDQEPVKRIVAKERELLDKIKFIIGD